MEEEKTVGLVETFDTGELSTELIMISIILLQMNTEEKIRRTILDSPGMCGDNSCTA